MPNVDSTLRHIAQWSHLIATDLTSAFYQIPLSRNSMKYCRSAMGMPGSETALEELMCQVLGELLKAGIVVKIADDLYCGGNTPLELLQNWEKVLLALHKADLRQSAKKTVINPQTATILGWVSKSGTLKASPHRVAALSSCPKPETVGRLRSFIGAFKVLARVIPVCSSLLIKLDEAVAGRLSKDQTECTDELYSAFSDVQAALASTCTITLPKPEDQLWIVTDGAVRSPGIGATLYVTRKGKLHVAEFFSARLRGFTSNVATM